jgi:ureidoglycolate lyase
MTTSLSWEHDDSAEPIAVDRMAVYDDRVSRSTPRQSINCGKEAIMKVVRIKAEPLTSEAFKPFGQVIGQDEVNLALKKGEEFRMGIIHMRNRGYQISRLNFHKNSTQALVPLEGKACLVVVAPPETKFKKASDLKKVKAFICDGSVGINLGLKTWHQALLPLGPEMKMLNVQGVNSSEDTYAVDFEEKLDAVLEVTL